MSTNDKSKANTTVEEALLDIIDWSEGNLPLWQQDALRRVIEADEDGLENNHEIIKELLNLCMLENWIQLDEENSLKSQAISRDALPDTKDLDSTSVAISSISEAKNINALMPNQTLSLSKDGLCIVFGRNGAGKSGYARILKQVCRSRAKDEEILTNVFSPPGPQSAKIGYEINGKSKTFEWRKGCTPPKELSHIRVFDSHSAKAFVEEKLESVYTPMPCRVLSRLGDLLKAVKEELQEKCENIGSKPAALNTPVGGNDTEVAKALRGLTSSSKVGDFKNIAALSSGEKTRLADLRDEFGGESPSTIKANIQTSWNAFSSLRLEIEKVQIALSPSAVEAYLLSVKDVFTKVEAVKLAAKSLSDLDELSGIQAESWKALWAAAKKFSEEEVYDGIDFPNTGDDSKCVLCHQPLGETAKTRMQVFAEFVQGDIEQALVGSKEVLAEKQDAISDCVVNKEKITEHATLLEGDARTAPLSKDYQAFRRSANDLAGQLKNATKDSVQKDFKELSEFKVDLIKDKEAALTDRISELGEEEESEERKKRLQEYEELRAKEWLGGVLPDVEIEINRRILTGLFKATYENINTKPITDKGKAIAAKLVTDEWLKRFKNELSLLGLDDVSLKLKPSGDTGTVFCQVALEGTKSGAKNVLSEGEYRCVALAGFLAELDSSHNKSGIIFDDPVCSLDHNHRHLVAKRLAAEASSGRQVLVFSHDLAFAKLLDSECRKYALKVRSLEVFKISRDIGRVKDDFFKKHKAASRLAGLKMKFADAEVKYKSGQQDEWEMSARELASELRRLWEDAVAEFFSPVIRVFDNQITVSSVRKLHVLEKDDALKASKGYQFCSDRNLLHIEGDESDRPFPEPSEFQAVIDDLSHWVEIVLPKRDAA